jgi:hypothetical protein
VNNVVLALSGVVCVVGLTWIFARFGWGVRPKPIDYVALALIVFAVVIGGRFGEIGMAAGGLVGFVAAGVLRFVARGRQ